MQLWTVWLDYLATGEGRTVMARVAYAEDERHALTGFAEAFGQFYADGAEAAPGVQQNVVTRPLFAPTVLASAGELEGRANLVLTGQFHYNLA